MQTARLIVFAESLTDMQPNDHNNAHSRRGGACWNIARVAARLGIPAGYAAALSKDHFDDELYQNSLAAGLDLRYLQRNEFSQLNAIGHRNQSPAYFCLADEHADYHLDISRFPEGWQNTVEIAHFGALGLMREQLGTELLELAISLKQAGVKISYDPNWRQSMGPGYLARFEIMLGLADYVKLSDKDLSHLLPDIPLESALNQACIWAGNARVLYTQGADGLQIIEEGRKHFAPAFKVPVVDAEGAGEASMGGWLSSILLQPAASQDEHARFAAATAAAACRQAGAYGPALNEVKTLLKEPA